MTARTLTSKNTLRDVLTRLEKQGAASATSMSLNRSCWRPWSQPQLVASEAER